jgi:hypothetical protein
MRPWLLLSHTFKLIHESYKSELPTALLSKS